MNNNTEQASTGAVRSHLYPPGTQFPARYDLMMRNAAGMRRLAETWGEGNIKYGPDNWMRGFPASVMISHCLEHIRLWLAGDQSEDHLAHGAWNLLGLCWIEENKPELMDLTRNPQVCFQSPVNTESEGTQSNTKFANTCAPEDANDLSGAMESASSVLWTTATQSCVVGWEENRCQKPPRSFTDKERLDAVEAIGKEGVDHPWILRDSSNGRGLRLHQTTSDTSFWSIRDAIDAYLRKNLV